MITLGLEYQPLSWSDVAAGPVPAMMDAVHARNASLDHVFYDVGGLTEAEQAMLLRERNKEGAILVVFPAGERAPMGVVKRDSYEDLLDAPGDKLRRFTVAGVGSSDLGAAAFARAVANRYDEPVGAVVAGYGVSDLLLEAVGGWLFLGGVNRVLQGYQSMFSAAGWPMAQPFGASVTTPFTLPTTMTTDTSTLVRLLSEAERNVVSLAGHSKGSLSVAYALAHVAGAGTPAQLERAQALRVTTVGAVAEFPYGFENVGQYLGNLDWFGGLNSRVGVDFMPVPEAWHHLNPEMPLSLDFDAVLANEPD